MIDDTIDDPHLLLESWLAEAQSVDPEYWNAAVLATATQEGIPSARVVLIKDFRSSGLTFYTNLQSRKARELTQNPRAALTFFWPGLHRQLRAEGSIFALSEEEAKTYFHTRPRESQIGAWASRQSQTLRSRQELLDRFARYQNQFQGAEVPLPAHWGGFQLRPTTLEFWQAEPHRLHDRLLFTWEDGQWRKERLYP